MITKHFYYIPIGILIACTLFVTNGCNQSKIIEEEKFIEVYTDMIIASDTTSEAINPKDEILKKILRKHNITFDDYKEAIQYYNQESQRWEKFFTKAIAYLEQKRKDSTK